MMRSQMIRGGMLLFGAACVCVACGGGDATEPAPGASNTGGTGAGGADGGDANIGGSAGTDSGANCPTGMKWCGACVDPDVDLANCGDCGKKCAPGEVCDGTGKCAVTCQVGMIPCTGKCVDPKKDSQYCGAGPDCATNPGATCPAGSICDGSGKCAISCQADLVNCEGKCTNPKTDQAHCGAGADCTAVPGQACAAGEVCNGAGVCELSCQVGLTNCGGKCIDPNTDFAHCGAGADCTAVPGQACAAGEVCNGAGVCELSCQVGLINCGGKCIDPNTDLAHCGAGADCTAVPGQTCNPGEVCHTGVCELSCQVGLTNCGGKCIDPNTDLAHCGAGADCAATAGEACDPGEICSLGVCVLACQAGLVDCGGKCVDPKTDLAHCGAGTDCIATPGVVCNPGEICDGSGVCTLSCQAGLVNCFGKCVDPKTDLAHCGAGTDCTASPRGSV